MFDIQNYGSFILTVLLFQMIPGAGTITILNATARGGTAHGMKAVFGTLTGDCIYMLAAVLGLAAVLSAYPEILASAQWFGVVYLFWIGLKVLRTTASNELKEDQLIVGSWTYYRQAFAVSLTNPKVIMFFMAFFPLFLHAGSTPATLILLMVHVTTISFLFQTGLVCVGNAVAARLSHFPEVRKFASRLAGLALIGFGLKLALSNR